MIINWLPCGGGSIHIVGPCPDCYATQGGLIIGTVSSTHKGLVEAKCVDCRKKIDYYVDVREKLIWKLEPVEAKGAQMAGTIPQHVKKGK